MDGNGTGGAMEIALQELSIVSHNIPDTGIQQVFSFISTYLSSYTKFMCGQMEMELYFPLYFPYLIYQVYL